MRINRLLWGLWAAMILSMLLRRQADIYMIVALIILPILIVLLDLYEEINALKEEGKHQRKFVMDRYNILQERLNDISSQVEKRLVVDFAEFAKNNQAEKHSSNRNRNSDLIDKAARRKKKRKSLRTPVTKPPVDLQDITFEQTTDNQTDSNNK